VEDQRLVEVLEEAQTRGFLGPGDPTKNVEHARGLVTLIGNAPERFLDLGSGAGVPGLVLALDWAESRAALLDSRERSCAWLEEAVERLDLTERVSVACGRAEDLARGELRKGFGLVVARSFGPPAVTAECAVGFLGPAGRLVVSEPPEAPASRWSVAGVAKLGFSPPEIRQRGEATAAVLTRSTELSDRWPRRAGIPAKRPLW
jgi:16S rRNA (guanine527-N7)-methyltransferase